MDNLTEIRVDRKEIYDGRVLHFFVDTVRLPSLSLCDDLACWLRDPVIRLEVTPSQEVAALQLQVQDLMAQLEALRKEKEVLMSRYSYELNFNFVLQDLLREHNIKWR